MTTIYLVRHGETDYNKRGIVQGSGINSSINELGQKQARLFFEKYHDLEFDAIWASKLQRTHQTLKGWVDRGDEIQFTEALNEINWGVHEGKQPSADQREDFLHTVRKWNDGHLEAKVEGGESPLEAWARAEEFFDQIRQGYQGKMLLMCSHGRHLRVLLSQLVDGDLQKMEEYSHRNTSLSIIELPAEGNATLITTNNLEHLEEEENNS